MAIPRMKEYPNFYENLQEAQARLSRTIVLYKDLPYHVLCITDHMKDGIFRMWLDPIGVEQTDALKAFRSTAVNYPNHPSCGSQMDALLDKFPECGIKRKHMNSPHFNRFRPFPLGMCNQGTQVYYVERQPIRPAMHQGLTKSGAYETLITAGSRQDNPQRPIAALDIYGPSFKDCILGDHYSPRQALRAMLDPRIANDALAFHREFAFVRGPIEMVFLAYRSDIIGVLPKNTFDFVRLGREFSYCKEVVAELGLFQHVIV